jgi:hypothetical protein
MRIILKHILLFLIAVEIFTIQTCSYFCGISESKNINITLKINDILILEDTEKIHQEANTFFFKNNGTIYLADNKKQTITCFNKSGKKLFTIGEYGEAPGQFIAINDIVQLPNKHFIVIDAIKQRLSEFDKNGSFLKILIDFNQDDGVIFPSQLYSSDLFILIPNCNAHILGDSVIYLPGSERSLYYGTKRTVMSLFRNFSYPDFKEISRGGNFSKKYNNKGFKMLERYQSIVTDSAFYFIEAATPYITKLTPDLKLDSLILSEGLHFVPIRKGLEEDVFLNNNIKRLFEWINGKSTMYDIFQHGTFVVNVYKNHYNFYDFISTVYKDNYNYFQAYIDSISFSNQSGKEDEYWCQVYSVNFKKYFGELKLPSRILGHDDEYIYLVEYRNEVKNKTRILKCKINVR